MPARTTPTRRPAASSRSRSGSTASRKRAPAKRPAAGGRKPPPRKNNSSGGAGLVRIVGGTWGLLARGVGGLARSVARPDGAEPLAPKHPGEGVGLAVLVLAVVLGAAVGSNGIGPVGEAIAGGTRGVVG